MMGLLRVDKYIFVIVKMVIVCLGYLCFHLVLGVLVG